MNPRRCLKCQGLGHIAVVCPNRTVITLAEWDAVKEEVAEEEKEESVEATEEGEEQIIAKADEGKMLVLRSALSSQKREQEEQRENIFYSRCTIQGKVYSTIINSGSYANVISLSMIERLNLQTSIHPHPYNIPWLNQSKGLQVNSRCLISFSIGKNYQDELWLHVIPMDACHMLLGRPWLFDRKVINNGYLHTYSFTKDGKKNTLTHYPLPSSIKNHPQKSPTDQICSLLSVNHS